MRYMVIETFKHGAPPVYARAAERGRMLPPGLVYVDSWIDERGLDRCFQLMETDDPSLLRACCEPVPRPSAVTSSSPDEEVLNESSTHRARRT